MQIAPALLMKSIGHDILLFSAALGLIGTCCYHDENALTPAPSRSNGDRNGKIWAGSAFLVPVPSLLVKTKVILLLINLYSESAHDQTTFIKTCHKNDI